MSLTRGLTRTLTRGVTRALDRSVVSSGGVIENSVLQVAWDGANLATEAVDDASGSAIAFVNGAKIVTAQSKFGDQSLDLDGTNDHCVITTGAEMNFTNGPFTIELHVRYRTNSGIGALVSKYMTGGKKCFILRQNGGNINFLYYNDAQSNLSKNAAFSPTLDTWYHMAICRDGDNLRAYIDGVEIGTTTAMSAGVALHHDDTEPVQVGAHTSASPTAFHDGQIDNLRIVIGTALYVTAFTPPSAPF